MKYKVILTEGEDGYIVVECPALPGCISQGKTHEEAVRNIQEAILLCLDCYQEEGKKAPEDKTEVTEVLV